LRSSASGETPSRSATPHGRIASSIASIVGRFQSPNIKNNSMGASPERDGKKCKHFFARITL
jgi:hypothetical protein